MAQIHAARQRTGVSPIEGSRFIEDSIKTGDNLFESMPRRAADKKHTWESWARHTGVQFQTSFSYYKMIGDYRASKKPKPDPDH